MILERIIVGPLEVNCYILGSGGQAVVIDPGAEAEKIRRRLNKLKLKAAYIVNTHGHADHIAADACLECPIYIHRLDGQFLTDPQLNLSAMLGLPLLISRPVNFLEHGQHLSVGAISLEVIHTPGHTPGGICLKGEGLDFVFTGDTLFAQGVGRTDIPEASEKDLLNSIRQRLFTLPDALKIYPGHGPSSTIGAEKKNNPFL